MKRLNGEPLASDEEEIDDVSYSEDGSQADADSNADGQAGNFSESEEDFFSDQEELEAVNSEELPDEDDELEMDDPGSDYGQEYDEEMEE